MELRISTKNLTVSDRFKDYVAEKSGKVEQLSHRPQASERIVCKNMHPLRWIHRCNQSQHAVVPGNDATF